MVQKQTDSGNKLSLTFSDTVGSRQNYISKQKYIGSKKLQSISSRFIQGVPNTDASVYTFKYVYY